MIVDRNELRLNEKELRARIAGADIYDAKEATASVREAMEPAYLIRKVKIVRSQSGLDLGFGCIRSSNLERNLSGCSSAYIVCATLGHGVDRLIRKAENMSAADTFFTDAAASAFVESLVDHIEDTLDGVLKPRFAPGYGDFSIEMQKDLMKFMRADGIGMGLTDKNLIIPQKSVTCVIGVTDED